MLRSLWLGCVLALAAGSVQAAGPAAAPAGTPPPPAGPAVQPSTPEPQRTTASFADWTLRCVRPEKALGNCEVAQTLFNNGSAFAQTVIGRPNRTEPMRLAIAVPVNVNLTVQPRMLGAENEPGFVPLNLEWRRCLGQACVADVILTEDLLRKLRARTDNSRILFADAAGREVPMPFGPKGLAQALDALAKEEQH